MRVSVVIPTFNNWRLTERCVEALFARTAFDLLAEVVVVDDASTDGESPAWTAAQSRVSPLLLAKNRGFSGACNAGAAQCTGEAILFLNNDAFAREGALQTMRDVLAGDESIGIVGARLLYSDGSLQHAGLALLPGAVSRWWHIHKRQAGTLPDAGIARDFLAVTGAALMIRRALFAELGGFDEGFINGWEDVDLCLRAWCAGARVRYVPGAVLEHLESATLGHGHDHERNERRFVERWQTLLADAPRYPLAEVPPIALAVNAAQTGPDDAWPLAHIGGWWKAHLGAAVMRTRPGSRLARAQVELLATVARRRPTLEISWGEACLARSTGPRRLAVVAPRTPLEARSFAGASNVTAWWTPTETARDLLLEAGVAADAVTVVRLGAETAAPPPRTGPPVIALAGNAASLLGPLRALLPNARLIALGAQKPPGLDGVDIVGAFGRDDRWGLLVPAAIGHGCCVVSSPPLDSLASASPGVTIVAESDLLEALVAKAGAIDDVRARANDVYLDARRRLDAYLATQRVSELARAITGGARAAALVEVDAGFARRLRGARVDVERRPTIAAHLIVGRNEESFLPALLHSLETVVDRVIVNDNSGNPDGPNARALAASAFALRGDLIVDRSPFIDFADARNRTLAIHRKLGLGDWAAFVDADEVHRPIAATIARNLARLPDDIAIVDGYTRHYFQSFRLYTSIERRMTFFRVTPKVRWTGRVHERLTGVAGKHLAIPYVYDHYGAVFSLGRQAAKGRQYSSLGQAGAIVTEGEEASVRAIDYFSAQWPLVLRYHGDHPPAVDELRALLERTDSERFTWTERTAARLQPLRVRAANLVRRLNFEYRWRGRALDPRARRLMRDDSAAGTVSVDREGVAAASIRIGRAVNATASIPVERERE
jgi:GT2 family glycosyltransferase